MTRLRDIPPEAWLIALIVALAWFNWPLWQWEVM